VTAHLAPLAALAASLPPGAVLAHVVTQGLVRRLPDRRMWAKIGDEPWRSVQRVEKALHRPRWDRDAIAALELTWDLERSDWATFEIVTESVVWEQGYGLRGRHEVMGVIG
jgi:hypothetical protein